jgi:hypothetical protein
VRAQGVSEHTFTSVQRMGGASGSLSRHFRHRHTQHLNKRKRLQLCRLLPVWAGRADGFLLFALSKLVSEPFDSSMHGRSLHIHAHSKIYSNSISAAAQSTVLAWVCVPLKFECAVINEGVAIAMQIKLQVAINLNKRETMQIREIHCK